MSDEIAVSLPRSSWQAVLESMTWPLPMLGDERHREKSEHSERCFEAHRTIRSSLGIPDIPTQEGVTLCPE